MNTITITFSYPNAIQPRYKFGDRVAIRDNNRSSKHWVVGEVIGLEIQNTLPSTAWLYTVRPDGDWSFTKKCLAEDLVFETKNNT